MTTQATLPCDQAIFTSIRGPMGEGYRIVAASRGMRPEEKQAITRLSPSHEALCWQPAGREDEGTRYAVAFYALPTGRLCVAYSRYAGAEHTARGGQRVYTHNLVFEERDFPLCGFNPFHVVRAMAGAGLTDAQLTPPATLPEVSLAIDADAAPSPVSFPASLDSPRRRFVLDRLLAEHAVIVPVINDWLASTETLLLGVPGPLRAKVSFGAGLRFSLGRCHRLHLFCDEKGVARSRIVGQPVDYVDSATPLPGASDSAWVAFVDRHWGRADVAGLNRRTSRPFHDLTGEARERIGTLYNVIDDAPTTASPALLTLAADNLRARFAGVEDEIRLELVVELQRALLKRFACIRWREAQPLWPQLIAIWREADADFAEPLIEAALRSIMREDPLNAAEAALDAAVKPPSAVNRDRHERLIVEILNQLASHTPADADPERLAKICSRWQSVRPANPALRKLAERCSAAQTAGATSR